MAKHAYPKQGGKHVRHRYGWHDFMHECAKGVLDILRNIPALPSRVTEAMYG